MRALAQLALATALLSGSPLPASGFSFGLPGAVRGAVQDLKATLTALPVAPYQAPSAIASATETPLPAPSATPTASETASPSASPSGSATPAQTPLLSATPTDSPSVSPSTTASPSGTATGTPTVTPSATPSATRTATPSATRTATRTPSFTATRTATPTNIPTLVAVLGTGSSSLGSDGPGTGSAVNGVRGITATNMNSLLYFTDFGSNQLRVYNPTGSSAYDAAFSHLTLAAATVGRWAGLANGASGSSLTTTPIQMNGPYAVVYDDNTQSLYVSESNANRVLVNFGTTTWFVWAGGGPCCALGDGGPATSARMSAPAGLAVQGGGTPSLYIADSGNHRVRSMLTGSPYTITTVAGTGTSGYLGDGAQARLARLNSPRGVAVHSSGDLYIADTMNHVIRRVDSNGVISTIAGGGPSASGYLDGVSTSARFDQPEQLFMDGDDLYVTEAGNVDVRRIALTNNYTVSTYVGGGAVDGPGAQPLNTLLNFPRGFVISGGKAYVGTDTYVYRFP